MPKRNHRSALSPILQSEFSARLKYMRAIVIKKLPEHLNNERRIAYKIFSVLLSVFITGGYPDPEILRV